jgi:putative hydrolase of HD superfamily
MSKKAVAKKPNIQRLFDLQNLLHQFHEIQRKVYLPGANRRAETDTEHVFTHAMTAWFLAQYFPELDTNIIIRQALVHDLVEIYAGDTYAFGDKTTIDSQADREQKALQRIAKEWPDFPEMTKAIEDYEDLGTPESCFVYALDKLMPAFICYMDEGHFWNKHKITYDQHHAKKSPQVQKSPQILHYYNEFVKLLQQNPHYFHQEKP